MENSTRRTFLALAGAGAAAAGVAAVAVPSAGDDRPAEPLGKAAGPMVAYVHDAGTGEVIVMVEGREVVVTDRSLVAAMHRAVAGSSRRS
jgi:hypothetical protein